MKIESFHNYKQRLKLTGFHSFLVSLVGAVFALLVSLQSTKIEIFILMSIICIIVFLPFLQLNLTPAHFHLKGGPCINATYFASSFNSSSLANNFLDEERSTIKRFSFIQQFLVNKKYSSIPS